MARTATGRWDGPPSRRSLARPRDALPRRGLDNTGHPGPSRGEWLARNRVRIANQPGNGSWTRHPCGERKRSHQRPWPCGFGEGSKQSTAVSRIRDDVALHERQGCHSSGRREPARWARFPNATPRRAVRVVRKALPPGSGNGPLGRHRKIRVGTAGGHRPHRSRPCIPAGLKRGHPTPDHRRARVFGDVPEPVRAAAWRRAPFRRAASSPVSARSARRRRRSRTARPGRAR